LADEPQQLRVELPRLASLLSITSATKIIGRVNVNLAPKAILSGLPGLDEVTAERIVASRQHGADLADVAERGSAVWLLIEGLVDIDKMKQLMPYVTAGGDVFRAEVIGFFDRRGPVARVEIVMDAANSPSQVVSWNDLGAYPIGSSRESLGADPSEARAVPTVGVNAAAAQRGAVALGQSRLE
jgi:hypothetical protein